MELKMSQYTPQQLNQIFLSTTRPLNALAASLYPSDAALDEKGNVISRSAYGKHDSRFGWEVDHRVPSAIGGSGWFLNLRALSCSDNRRMGGILGQALRR